MRAFVLFLLFTTPGFAQTSFDSHPRVSELADARDTTIMRWRVSNRFSGELPNDNYVKAYQEAWEKFNEDQLKLHDELCSGSDVTCPDKNLLSSQARIEIGVLTVKNRWAQEGKSSESQQSEAEAAFKKCVEEQTDCDRLSQAEQILANEARPAVTSATVNPDTTVTEVTQTPETGVTTTTETLSTISDPVVSTPVTEVSTGENPDEKNPKNYVPETCVWVEDLPRKVVNGPGCGPRNRSKICTGYVKCKQKDSDAFFVRMSTCGPELCGNDDAVACTKDLRYYSGKPEGESKLFMSQELKEAVTGSTRQ